MRLMSLVSTLVVGARFLWGQATQVSQVSGTTMDESRSAIAGASITIANVDTGISRATVSGADGAYLITNLPVGQYRLQARKDGLAAYVQSGIVLNVDSNPRIDFTMRVGEVSEQIEVSASAALVETQSTGVGQVIDQDRVVELPLNGRNITQLVTLAGGATDFVPTSAGQSLIRWKPVRCRRTMQASPAAW